MIDRKSLAHVARKLNPLKEKFAFTGGAIIPLLVDDPLIAGIRPTKDVDIIIEIFTRLEFFRLEEQLRGVGFRHDMSEGAPKCRWVVDGLLVDVMPVSGEAADPRSKWFPEALAAAGKIELVEGVTGYIITAPYFIATKLEAFFDRGNNDFYGSVDLEDIITVLDGRESIIKEIDDLPRSVRVHLSGKFSELIESRNFMESLPGHLLPDTASQERIPRLIGILRRLANF
jgi:hypothetical protein